MQLWVACHALDLSRGRPIGPFQNMTLELRKELYFQTFLMSNMFEI